MERLRLGELLAGLSLLADMGMGLEPGEAAGAALVAMELAARVDAEEPDDVYYTTLLQHIGCTAYAHEAAAMLGGDEIAVKHAAVHTNFGDRREVAHTYLPNLAPAAGMLARVRAAGTAVVRAREIVRAYSRANCEVAARTAERAGLGPGVTAGLLDIYEQWDGRGGPRGLRGEEIAQSARIAQVAATAVLFTGPVEARRLSKRFVGAPALRWNRVSPRPCAARPAGSSACSAPLTRSRRPSPRSPCPRCRSPRTPSTACAGRSARPSISRRRCITAMRRASPSSPLPPASGPGSTWPRERRCGAQRSYTTSAGRRSPTASGSVRAR